MGSLVQALAGNVGVGRIVDCSGIAVAWEVRRAKAVADTGADSVVAGMADLVEDTAADIG